MMITRRLLLGGLTATAAAPRLWAQTDLAVGTGTLTTLSDGHLVLPAAFFFDPMPAETIAPILAAAGIDPAGTLEPPCNVTLWRDGTNTILFDAGSGPGFMPTAGRLPDALDAAGVAPEEVTHVIFTHGHPDHLWGVLDDFDEPLFPDAQHLIGAAELAYWTDPATVSTIGEARAAFAAGAARRLDLLGDRIATFEDGAELAPGITARASHGHTPGHMAFRVAEGGSQAMVVGDAIGNAHVAFAAPALPSGADQDMQQAADTRQRLLDELASDDIPLIGFHLPGGGAGRVAREGDAYRFVPM